jgi:hypothetical protein
MGLKLCDRGDQVLRLQSRGNTAYLVIVSLFDDYYKNYYSEYYTLNSHFGVSSTRSSEAVLHTMTNLVDFVARVLYDSPSSFKAAVIESLASFIEGNVVPTAYLDMIDSLKICLRDIK